MGVIVIVMMGVIIHAVSQPVLKNGSRVLSPRAEQALPILYGVLAYGIAALIAGLWHVFTGKANKILLYVVSGTGVLIAIVAKIINIAK
jgi:hypothetical protein